MAKPGKNVLVTIQFVSKVERAIASLNTVTKKFNDVARSVKETNDKLTIISKKLDNAGKSAKAAATQTQAAAKQVQNLSDEALKASAKLTTLTQRMQAASVRAQNLSRSAQIAAVGADKMQAELKRATATADALSREAVDVASRISVLTQRIKESGDRSGKLQKELDTLSKRAGKLATESQKANLRVEALANGAKQAGIRAQTFAANANQAMRQVTRLGTQMRVAEVTARNLGADTNFAAKAVDTYGKEARDATQQSHVYANAIQGVAQAAQGAAQKVQQLTQATQQTAQTAQQTAQTAQQMAGAGGAGGGGNLSAILAGFAGGVGAGALGVAMKGLSGFANFAKNIATGLVSTLGKMVMAPVNFVKTIVGATFNTISTMGSVAIGLVKAMDQVGMAFEHARVGVLHFTESMSRFLYLLGDTFSFIRQVGQGLQTFAYLLTAVVTVPIGGFLQYAAKSAMDLDHAMTEVRKTTNLSTDDVKELKEGLLDLSLTTPTDVIDLATFAADWGRMGVRKIDDILRLTHISDMLVTSTDIAASEVTNSLGKIGNIFYGTTQGIVENAEAMGSAINAVADASVISEAELMATLLRAAPMLKMLNISLPDAIGLAATAASTNASAERAGTQLGTAYSKLANNIDKVTIATGLSEQAIKDMMDENPAKLFLSIIDGTNGMASNTERLQLVTEIFGETGGKAVSNLSSAYDILQFNIALANEEFDRATSLQLVYLAALDSTQNQLDIVRNNFKYLGITVGDTLLPIFTKIFAAVIPMIEMVTNAFKNLPKNVQLSIVAFGALAAALGPVLLAIGSLMFSIGIIGTGTVAFLNTIVGVIGRLVGSILYLFGLLATPSIFLTGLTAAMVVIITKMTQTGDSIATIFKNLVKSAYNWGYNLIATFTNGIYGATAETIRAVKFIGTTIARFLQSFSPPKEGPLKEIDTWGYNLGTTFAEAFAEADIAGVIEFTRNFGDAIRSVISGFSSDKLNQFEEFLSMGSSIVSAFGGVLNLDSDVITVRVNEFASKLASIFSGIDDGMDSASGVFGSLGDYIGSFTGDFEKLLQLQIDYNKENERLIQLKERLENFDKETTKRIEQIAGSTTMTGLQRVAAIRQIRYEAEKEKESLEEQVKQREKNVEKIEEQVQAQKQLINIIQSLIPRTSKPAKEKEEKIDEIAGDLTGMDPIKVAEDAAKAQEEVNKLLEDTGEKTKDFLTRIDLAREKINGFFYALGGGQVDLAKLDQYSEEFLTGFEAGATTRLYFLVWLNEVKTILSDIYDYGSRIWHVLEYVWKGIQTGWSGDDSFLSDLTSRETLDALGMVESILASIGEFLGSSAKKAYDFMNAFATGAALDPRIMPPIMEAIKEGKPIMGAINFYGIGEFIAEKINEYILTDLAKVDTSPFVSTIGKIFDSIAGFVATVDMDALTTAIASVPNTIIKTLKGITEDGSLDGALKNITDGIVMLLDKIDFTGAVDVIGNIAEKIATALAGVDWSKLTGIFSAIGAAMARVIAELPWKNFAEIFSGIAKGILEGLSQPEVWANLKETLGSIVDVINRLILEVDFAPLATTLGTAIQDAIIIVFETIEWVEILTKAFESFKTTFGPVIVQAIGDAILENLKNLIPGYRVGEGVTNAYNFANEQFSGAGGNSSSPQGLSLKNPLTSFTDAFKYFFGSDENAIAEQAKKSGETVIGPAIGAGISTYMETDTQVSTATEQALLRLANNKQVMDTGGSAISTSLYDSYTTFFKGTAETEVGYFDSVMAGFDTWTMQSEPLIEKSTSAFVKTIAKYVNLELQGESNMFNGIIVAMNEWFAVSTVPILDSFLLLGEKISEAISLGIISNKDDIWDSLEDLFTPPKIVPLVLPQSISQGDNGDVVASGARSASNVFNVNITVNSGQNQQQMAQEIARTVEQQISRKLQLTGNYRNSY